MQKPLEAPLLWLTGFLLLASFAFALLPASFGRQKASSPNEALRIEVVQSSDELHETLKDKPPLTFGATRTPNLTITVNDAVNTNKSTASAPHSPILPHGCFGTGSPRPRGKKPCRCFSVPARVSA